MDRVDEHHTKNQTSVYGLKNSLKMEVQQSRINTSRMSIQDRMAAIRFILSIDEGTWMHVNSLPAFVFDYVFETGMLLDLPWIRWREDDLGYRIQRIKVTDNPREAAEMAKESSLLRLIGFKDIIISLYLQEIGLVQFERLLLQHCRTNMIYYKHKLYI